MTMAFSRGLTANPGLTKGSLVMKRAHRLFLLSGTIGLVFAAPVAQAGVLSIGDLGEALTLNVAAFNQITGFPGPAPGSGDSINLAPGDPSQAAHGLSNVNYNAALETLSFTFRNQVNWPSDFYAYRYYTEAGGGLSDLYVIQGLGGTTPDDITFISDPGVLTGNITDIVPLIAGSSATPINLGTVPETGSWQLAFNTGVDQYYIASDVPEPSTWAMLTLGFRRAQFCGV
jgi:hypothetical protein